MNAISTFAREWAFVTGLILAFGACGIGLVIPLLANVRQIYFCAPLVGVLVVPVCANAFYVLLRTDHAHSTLITAAGCLSLTILRLVIVRPALDRRSALFGFAGLFVISALAVLTMDAATIRLHGPAIFYIDGTDLGGYSHVADWLNDHTIDDRPIASPSRPYESWPALLFGADPRFGAFSLLAIISHLHGTSAIFSYDAACAVIITAATLGVGGIFARSLGLTIILALGLFVSHWFDYSQYGYLGKLISYPGAFFLCGLTLNSLRSQNLEKISILLVISAAVGTMHSGGTTTFLTIPIFGVALIAIAIWSDERTQFSTAIFLCAMVSAMPLIASGILSRPLSIGPPDYNVSWSYIAPRILDLESQGILLSGVSPVWLEAHVAVAIAAWIGLLALAVHGRNVCATSLLGGSAILLLGIVAVGAEAVAFQLIGFFYPAVICGALVQVADGRAARAIALTIAMLTIAQRVPRFIGAIDRYALYQNEQYLFSSAEIDRLAKEIGPQTVQIDVVEPHAAILLLIELGRRKLDLQWSQRGWNTVLDPRQRAWPLPVWNKPPTFLLKLVSGGGAFNHFGRPDLGNTIPSSVGSPIGNLTGYGGLAASFDDNLNKVLTSCSTPTGGNEIPAARGYNNFIGKDWGIGIKRKITGLRLFPATDQPIMQGAEINLKLQGSDDNVAWTDLYKGSELAVIQPPSLAVMMGIDSSTAYRFHRVNIQGNGINALVVCQIQFIELPIN